jgi:hypothetical protein
MRGEWNGQNEEITFEYRKIEDKGGVFVECGVWVLSVVLGDIGQIGPS